MAQYDVPRLRVSAAPREGAIRVWTTLVMIAVVGAAFGYAVSEAGHLLRLRDERLRHARQLLEQRADLLTRIHEQERIIASLRRLNAPALSSRPGVREVEA
ncbi:hypothetical protein [Bordetella sp. LUAb4]|uniref:hypothetical protein n=1 Tax=Bordetella sp. LUAb4 TaxID=2843195 RepID=UPI001E5629C1|nr:hypothetical protein [Bordetella sp. LUAb4]